MNASSATVVMAVLPALCAVAPAQAPKKTTDSVLLAPPTWEAWSDPGRTPAQLTSLAADAFSVRLVDAGSGQVLSAATLKWVDPLAEVSAGVFQLPGKAVWYEASAAGYLFRRGRLDVRKEHGGKLAIVPLLPALVMLRGKVTSPFVFSVKSAGVDAADRVFGVTVAPDAQGRFHLPLRAASLPTTEILFMGFGGELARQRVATVAGKRRPLTMAEHRGAEETDAEFTLVLPPERERVLRKYQARGNRAAGGTPPQVGTAIDAALAWLARHQDEDGRFDSVEFAKHDPPSDKCDGAGEGGHDVGLTALALLCFMADGNTIDDGRYAGAVRRGVEWLVRTQHRSGVLEHFYRGRGHSHFIYDHTLATLALCEAWGMSGTKPPEAAVRKAVSYLLSHRNETAGWRYEPRGGDNDVSITCWAMQALLAARDFGLVDDLGSVVQHVDQFLAAMTDEQGRTGYIDRGGLSSRKKGPHERQFPAGRNETMTAAALCMRGLLRHAHFGVRPLYEPYALAILVGKPPREADNAYDSYAWALGAQAVCLLGDDKARNAWLTPLWEIATTRQAAAGSRAGSFEPVDVWGVVGGRIFTTAMMCLALQSPMRFGPVPR